MKKRLFIAIPLTQEILEELNSYKKQTKIENARWTAPQNLHITLYFLGSIEEEEIPDLVDRLNASLIKTKRFSLTFQNLTLAPPNKQPSMIWAQFESNKHYEQLCNKIYNSIHKYASKSEPDKSHEIIPHITLARFKNTITPIDLTQTELSNFTVKACHLMESKLNSDGLVYSTIATFFFDVI